MAAEANKKEAFRQYLEQAGVLDTMTKILVNLYEEGEKPKNAIDYIKGLLGAPTPAEFNALKSENEALQKQLQDAQNQMQELAAKAGEGVTA